MKQIINLLLVFSILGSASLPAFSAVKKFTDMPKRHWASKAVYELVKMGVTQGFPDGTFRGTQKMTRYETAYMLYKLANSLGATEVLELREQAKELKEELITMRKTGGASGIYGNIETYFKLGNSLASKGNSSKGPVMTYRLKTILDRQLGEDASVKVTLDTMDAGFGGGSQDIATKLLDFEGRLTVKSNLPHPVDVLVTIGPGPITHTDRSGVLPAENNQVYQRPKNAVYASTKMGGSIVKGAYIAEKMSTTEAGYVDVNRLQAELEYTTSSIPRLGIAKFSMLFDYLTKDPLSADRSLRDLRMELAAVFTPHTKSQLGFKLGAGGKDNTTLLSQAFISLADVWDSGTFFDLKTTAVGVSYFSTLLSSDLAGYDIFSRALPNNCFNTDITFRQIVNDEVFLKFLASMRTNGNMEYGIGKQNSLITMQGGLVYDIASSTLFEAYYRILQDPNNNTDPTTDMIAFGLKYKF